jgi:hypothetical protein
MRETNPMKKSAVVNRPSSQRDLLGMSTPETNWYSQYWLEDKPWPDLAFCVGRSLRRGARIVIPIVRTSGLQAFRRLSTAFSGSKWLRTRGAER